MKLNTFTMERWQSEWEHEVEYNLSESGVHPLQLSELLTSSEIPDFLDTGLGYIQTDGTAELKDRIKALYPGADRENILVTSGSIEANFLLLWSLLEAGDEVVYMLPNFLQMQGLAEAFDARIKTFTLKPELDWNPDLEELKKIVTKNTKLILITNPNNPTGGILNDTARQTIIELAKWADAWIISDEVYQGAEWQGENTPSFWEKNSKTVITNGLSKAYGLPGLRTGWMVGPRDLINKVWTYKDYTSITISALSDRIARLVLEPEKRAAILKRTRDIILGNFPIFEAWMAQQKGIFTCTSPQAGAIAFPRYSLDINSTRLAERVRDNQNVLICAGDQFGLDHYIRISLGESGENFRKGLDRVGRELQQINKP